eukprot:tig00021366_g20845.t1
MKARQDGGGHDHESGKRPGPGKAGQVQRPGEERQKESNRAKSPTRNQSPTNGDDEDDPEEPSRQGPGADRPREGQARPASKPDDGNAAEREPRKGWSSRRLQDESRGRMTGIAVGVDIIT